MRILVAGATGVLGCRTVPHLVAHGHQMVGLARDAGRANAVRSLGAEPVIGNLFDLEAVMRAARGCEAVLHLATRIPTHLRTTPADWAENDRVRTEGTRHLLDVAQRAGASYYVQQSITFIYGDHGDDWIDESTPIPAALPPVLRSAVEMERLVEASGLPHAVLRAGTFYGRGTGTTEVMLAMLQRRRLPVVGSGAAFTSMIHVEDMGRAVAAAVEQRLEGVFNIVDDEPVRQRDLLEYAAKILGAGAPYHAPVWLARLIGGPAVTTVLRSQRVSNARLRAALGFLFTYPTYRDGLAEPLHA